MATPPQEEEPSFFPQGRGQEGGKFVPLYSNEGKKADVVRLAGRHECECQAVKHGLVSNCLGCGRIVCSQEGSGSCLFCGSLVVTREEQVVLDRKSKKSEELYKKLAERHKSRLDRRITFDFAGRKVVEAAVAEYSLERDTELLDLFKNDAFSVADEIGRRAEQGSIANPKTDRSRPLYNETPGGRSAGACLMY